jgi:hypothetical protein
VSYAPFITLTCLVGAWLLYWRKYRRIAVLVAAVPTIAVVLVAGTLVASGFCWAPSSSGTITMPGVIRGRLIAMPANATGLRDRIERFSVAEHDIL